MAVPVPMTQQPVPVAMGGDLWPNGCGFTERDKDPDSCSCAPCYCISMPIWFASKDFSVKGQEARVDPNLCKCQEGWTINNADVMNVALNFEGKELCGVESIYEPEIHVTDATTGDFLGKTVMKCPLCVCWGEAVMTEVRDKNNTLLFERLENVCYPEFAHWSGECCGWQQFRFPIFRGGERNKFMPLTYLTWKYHCCACCRPQWIGIENFPPGLSQDEQKLLVAVALSKWWRSERAREAQQQNQGQ